MDARGDRRVDVTFEPRATTPINRGNHFLSAFEYVVPATVRLGTLIQLHDI